MLNGKILITMACVLLIATLLGGWYELSPSISGVDLMGGQERIGYEWFYQPISGLFFIIASVILIKFRFNLLQHTFLIFPLLLAVIAAITFITPLFLVARSIFTPLKG